jgi:ribonuclease PH
MKVRTALAAGIFLATASAFGQTISNWPCADDLKKIESDTRIIPVSTGVAAGLVKKKVRPDVSGLEHSKAKSDVPVRVLIGKDGIVRCAVAENGDSDLWARSVNAAKQWQFRPYLLNGEPVIIETMIEFTFNKSRVSVHY